MPLHVALAHPPNPRRHVKAKAESCEEKPLMGLPDLWHGKEKACDLSRSFFCMCSVLHQRITPTSRLKFGGAGRTFESFAFKC